MAWAGSSVGTPLGDSRKTLSKREASQQAPQTPEAPKPHAPVLCVSSGPARALVGGAQPCGEREGSCPHARAGGTGIS